MDGIYQWIGSIVSYLVFTAVLMGLLPAVRYERYLRLFAGCILILLVFQPLTSSLRLETVLEQLFRSVSVKEEVYGLLWQEERFKGDEELAVLEQMEEERISRILSVYEEEMEQEIERMAAAAGFAEAEVAVLVEHRTDRMDFAGIRQVCVWIKASGEPTEMTQNRENEGYIQPVEVAEVRAAFATEKGTEHGTENREEDTADGAEGKWLVKGAKAEALKQQIAAYCQVEEAYVEIRLEDR